MPFLAEFVFLFLSMIFVQGGFAQMHIDREAIGQLAVNDATTTLSNVIIDTTGGLIGKRDLDANDLQLLGQLPLDKLAQLVDVVNIPDRTIALHKLRHLLQQFFPEYQGRTDFDDIADDLLDQLNNILPHLDPSNFPNQG